MRVRVYLSYLDIKEACRRHKDVFTDVEIATSDVQFISLQELQRLIDANPEYVPLLLNYLKERWGE
jgi:hypothetical protein